MGKIKSLAQESEDKLKNEISALGESCVNISNLQYPEAYLSSNSSYMRIGIGNGAISEKHMDVQLGNRAVVRIFIN